MQSASKCNLSVVPPQPVPAKKSPLPQTLPSVINLERSWNLYFDRFGCISCGQKDEQHQGHGFCIRCRDRVLRQLKHVLAQAH